MPPSLLAVPWPPSPAEVDTILAITCRCDVAYLVGLIFGQASPFSVRTAVDGEERWERERPGPARRRSRGGCPFVCLV